jgi:hypothetical protein
LFEWQARRELEEMVTTWFSKPVSIAEGISGHVVHVENAAEAAAMLTKSWPRDGSAKQKAAWRACAAAMRGEAAPDTARVAFVEAAEEARILVEFHQDGA